MGIRESMNKNPGVTTGVTVGIILIALAFVGYEMFGGGPPTPKGYFSNDDGKSWTTYDDTSLPGIDNNGAVRAYLFSCNGGPLFCGYVEKVSDKQKAVIAALVAAGKKGSFEYQTAIQSALSDSLVVKHPDDREWVSESSRRGLAVITVKCPDGTTAPTPMFPEN